MADDIYTRDLVAWAEAQGDALRRRSANELDWDNVAEEIETLGRSETRAVESQVINILAHFLKIEFSGASEPLNHWRGEIGAFRIDLDRDLTPTLAARMPARLDELYAYAVRALRNEHLKLDEAAPAYPATCPYTWDDVRGRGAEWTPDPKP
jgi:hypothetical protein